jgi:uncharacterized protein YuzE
MRVTYDRRADAAYIYLREIELGGSKQQCPVDCQWGTGMIVLDIDGEGRLIGIEVIGAQNGLPHELLELAQSEPPPA